jgi:hypothetical protein
MSTTKLSTVASNLDICELGDERVIDFDIAANTDYEVQSCVIVDEDDRVVEAVVRFGRVEERPELFIDKSVLYPAWVNMVSAATNVEAVEGDLSDFSHIVPHLRVRREGVEKYGLETLSLDAFVNVVAELADLTEDILRGDDKTIDSQIDAYL